MRLSKLILFLIFIPVLAFARGDYYKGAETVAVVNGFVGKTSAGTSGAATLGIWYYSQYTPTAIGTIRYLHAYVEEQEAGNSTMCLGIWTDSTGTPGTLVGSCSITWDDSSAQGWQYCDMGSDKTITDQTYHIGLAETAGAVTFYKAIDGDTIDYDIGGYSTCATDSNLADDGDTGTEDLKIFADNVDQAEP